MRFNRIWLGNKNTVVEEGTDGKERMTIGQRSKDA